MSGIPPAVLQIRRWVLHFKKQKQNNEKEPFYEPATMVGASCLLILLFLVNNLKKDTNLPIYFSVFSVSAPLYP